MREWAQRRQVVTWALAAPLLVGCALGASSCAAPAGSGGPARTARSPARVTPHRSVTTGVRPAATTDAATLPPLPSSLLTSLSNTDNAFSIATGQSATVSLPSAVSAVLAADGAGSVPKGAELLTLHWPQPSSPGTLVWAIWVVPEDGYMPFSGPAPIPGSGMTVPKVVNQSNYEVDFVNAATGELLYNTQSYDPALGPPPS